MLKIDTSKSDAFFLLVSAFSKGFQRRNIACDFSSHAMGKAMGEGRSLDRMGCHGLEGTRNGPGGPQRYRASGREKREGTNDTVFTQARQQPKGGLYSFDVRRVFCVTCIDDKLERPPCTYTVRFPILPRYRNRRRCICHDLGPVPGHWLLLTPVSTPGRIRSPQVLSTIDGH